jgi:Tfp pilus assembly protein PilE
MKRPVRTLLLVLMAVPILLIVSCSLALPSYDNYTREKVLRTVAVELPPHASMKQMEEFMMRHAPGRYSYDDMNDRWDGLLPQSSLDRAIFDRQVGVSLKTNKGTRTFRGADAEIYYTFI